MKRNSVEHAPRTPVNRFDYTNVLAMKFQRRYHDNTDYEEHFRRLSKAFHPLIVKLSTRLASIRNEAYEDAYPDVLARFFELTIEFDPNKLHYGAYIKRKLTAWATWEGLKRSRRAKEQMRYLDNERLTAFMDHQDHYAANEAPFTGAEIRNNLSNCKEATSDLLFMRHMLSLTQTEISHIFGVHQFTISLYLKEAHDHILRSSLLQEAG